MIQISLLTVTVGIVGSIVVNVVGGNVLVKNNSWFWKSLWTIIDAVQHDERYLVLQEQDQQLHLLDAGGLHIKPSMIGFYFTGVESSSFTGVVQRIQPPHHHREWIQLLQRQWQSRHSAKEQQKQHRRTTMGFLRSIEFPMSSLKTQEDIETGSEYYSDEKPHLTTNPKHCTPMYAWQIATTPVCNSIHEYTMAHDRMYLHSPFTKSKHTTKLRFHQRLRRSLLPLDEFSHGDHSLRRRLKETLSASAPEQFQMLASGYWRDTWMMQTPLHHHQNGNDNTISTIRSNSISREQVAFKTIRYEHDITEYVLDKSRRDAVVSDRVTSSSHVIHMYAYCGTSALYEYAPGGDLEAFLDDNFDTPQDYTNAYPVSERYLLAYNVTAALKDLHTTEGIDRPTAIVHGDFKADQFVATTTTTTKTATSKVQSLPHFKLGDFNLARMVYWNKKKSHPCVIKPDGNGGGYRSPEEYAMARGRTEKIDIYSLGNLLYTILTGHYPFDDFKTEDKDDEEEQDEDSNDHGDNSDNNEDDDGDDDDDHDDTATVRQLVKRGIRPHIDLDGHDRDSHKDPQVRALLRAIDLCWQQDPHDRPSAVQVLKLLEEEL